MNKYYVGDLCYVMHPEWDEVCDLMFPANFNNSIEGTLALKDGRKFSYRLTKYGDGIYFDQYGNKYGVDAGIIGVIAIEDISEDLNLSELQELGCIHEFDNLPDVEYNNGTIIISDVIIKTDDL